MKAISEYKGKMDEYEPRIPNAPLSALSLYSMHYFENHKIEFIRPIDIKHLKNEWTQLPEEEKLFFHQQA